MKTDFSIYRILGNDLPPRHGEKSSLKNLQYILEHEADFPDTQKWWVLNRIVDKEQAKEMAALITGAGQHYLDIPFDSEKHFASFLDVSGFPKPIYRAIYGQGYDVMRLEWIIRHKSQLIVNINHARNAALAHGRNRSRWILPLDGGVMFPAEGWESFTAAAREVRDAKFVVIAMQRLIKGEAMPTHAPPKSKEDEPQIAFRSDATDIFDERLRYGNHNKTELLARLGLPGPWDSYTNQFWDKDVRLTSPDHGKFVRGGFTVRLATGASGIGEKSGIGQWLARFKGVDLLSEKQDLLQAHRNIASSSTFYAYNQRPRFDSKNFDLYCKQLMEAPVRAARSASSQELHSMFLGANRSFSARLKQAIGLASARTGTLGRGDTAGFQESFRHASVLAHGGAVLGNKSYAKQANQLLETWLVDEKTRMPADLRAADGDALNASALVPDLWLLPQTVETLRTLKAISPQTDRHIASWCAKLLHGLEASYKDQSAKSFSSPASTWMMAIAAALYLHTDNVDSAMQLCRHAPERVVEQISPSGRQAHIAKGPRPLHDALFNLEGWAAMVCVCLRVGMRLAKYHGQNGESLGRAVQFLSEHRNRYSDYKVSASVFDRRISILTTFFTGTQLAANASISEIEGSSIPPLWPQFMPRLNERSAGIDTVVRDTATVDQ